MVTTSGFSSTPLSRLLILSLIVSSLAASILDIKHLLPIKPTPHLWPYLQFSRVFTYQLASISSAELIVSVVTLYHMRVLERLWGTRKFGSFVVTAWLLCGVGTVTLGILAKIVTWGKWGYIPPGMTGLVFAMLAVWRGEVPRLYGVKVITGIEGRQMQRADGQQGSTDAEKGIVCSDKFTTYLLAAQLTFSQFPFQMLPALVGWVVGVAWREELLPTGMIRWRLPGWVVGESAAAKRGRGQYEGLRRRLEEEGGARDGMREVSDGVVNGQQQEQREGFGSSITGYFTGS